MRFISHDSAHRLPFDDPVPIVKPSPHTGPMTEKANQNLTHKAVKKPQAHSIAIRLAAFYAAQFLVVGIYIPFWPIWLASRGLSIQEIGLLVGIGLWTKLASNAIVTQIADRHGPRQVMIILGLANIPIIAAFWFAETFWALVPLTILSSALFSGKFPLSESVTLAVIDQHNLHYGSLRLWGSCSFIIVVTGTGWVVDTLGVQSIFWLILGGVVILAGMCFFLPSIQRPQTTLPNPLSRAIATPGLLPFIICASLIQASHAAYYGFATLHWQAVGHSELTIGALWAEGVMAEIVLFALSGAILRRLKPLRLLALSALAGVIRWVGLGLTDDLYALIVLQSLHALTFAATHLAAMRYIADHAPHGAVASAQGIYSSLAMGAFMGLATMVAGWLFGQGAIIPFMVMAALAAIGGILLGTYRYRQAKPS